MALTPGSRLGVYDITAPIGEGGMGQVWRARQVAIKILPDAFAADPERLARFEREAKTLASLNHSYIAAIYAVGGTDGRAEAHPYLVMISPSGSRKGDPRTKGPRPTGRSCGWIDRSGGQQRLDVSAGMFRDPELSPDGRQIAFVADDAGNTDVWAVGPAACTSGRFPT